MGFDVMKRVAFQRLQSARTYIVDPTFLIVAATIAEQANYCICMNINKTYSGESTLFTRIRTARGDHALDFLADVADDGAIR